MSWLTRLFNRPSNLELSPSDWVSVEAANRLDVTPLLEDVKRQLSLGNLPRHWIPPVPEYKDPSTGSMLPNFSHEHNNLLIAGLTGLDHNKIGLFGK